MTLKPLFLGMSLITAVAGSAATQADIRYSEASIKAGQQLFALNCTSCHGYDGKATVNFVADATNLTTPDQWRGGDSRQHIFDAIKGGQAVDMPAFEWILSGDEDIWHLTNFVLSLWPQAARNRALAEYQPVQPE